MLNTKVRNLCTFALRWGSRSPKIAVNIRRRERIRLGADQRGVLNSVRKTISLTTAGWDAVGFDSTVQEFEMTPLISEFSYGYAITDELIHSHDTPVTAAPVFPSLYQEGQIGGGYDVMLTRPVIPLFIQFKLSHCLVRHSAIESRFLSLPFYRMHLRPLSRSKQHSLLLALEAANNEVYYCAPAFHTPYELNDAYLNQEVCERSIWPSPSCIGPLPDSGPHHVAFQGPKATHGYLCSTPRRIDATFTFGAFVDRIREKLKNIDRNKRRTDPFANLAESLRGIAARQQLLTSTIPDDRRFSQLRPIEQAAVLANILYDSLLYVAALK